MTFEVPESNNTLILKWVKDTLNMIDFVKDIKIYEADCFVDDNSSFPVMALQRSELQTETDPTIICASETNVMSTLTVTLHVDPAPDEHLDPVLHYFEEQAIKYIERAALGQDGRLPNCVNYFKFFKSDITNQYRQIDDSLFSNVCKLEFTFGFSL